MFRPVSMATEPEYVLHEAKAVASEDAVIVVVPEVLHSRAMKEILVVSQISQHQHVSHLGQQFKAIALPQYT